MIRVLVVDDHAIVRAGVRALLGTEPDIDIVAEAADGNAALDAVGKLLPDVMLADLSLPAMNGVELIRRAHALSPALRIVVLSMHASPEYVRPALQAGASGYVVKGSGLDDLVSALRAVAGGETYLDECIDPGSLDGPHTGDDLERLTPREREVLRLVAQGRTNREIGALLGLSPKTADAHRTNLMRKLDLHDAQALTRFALKRGLVD